MVASLIAFGACFQHSKHEPNEIQRRPSDPVAPGMQPIIKTWSGTLLTKCMYIIIGGPVVGVNRDKPYRVYGILLVIINLVGGMNQHLPRP